VAAASEPFSNRLIHEKSPYLLQHAHNPVDWYPWGDEAFQAAKDQDKPIFLSIGYATCHWCHVMEKESFSDPEVARLLNDTFINVKVDREELPEVDNTYMEFAQALLASSAGWPLNLVLTPDLKPFFAVTYLPPKSRRGLIGIDEFVKNMQILWKGEERMLLVEQADKLVEVFSTSVTSAGEDLPEAEQVSQAAELLFAMADPIHGGMKGAPKFPLGYQAEFLLQYTKADRESRALFYVELTLDKMQQGGIYDHLGGGFSRYTVDELWEIPHFEKTLYDNALLAKAYLEAWKYTKKPAYVNVVKETLEYILREMTSPEGGFYSGQDADTEGHEGRFYTWTPQEVAEVLSPQVAELFCHLYGVTAAGNFEGRSVLHMQRSLEEMAEMFSLPLEEMTRTMTHAKAALFEKRKSRTQPLVDDKIITAWNGLMIDVLARAGSALNLPTCTQAALKAVQCIRTHLWKEGRLLRRFRQGEAKHAGVLEDYAFLLKGVLTLFELGQGTEYLEWAVELARMLEVGFKAPQGAFFQTDEREAILWRKCDYYDGAEPSGNAVHAENLLRLYQITQIESYLKQAEDIFKAIKNYLGKYSPGAFYHLMALQRYFDKKAPLVVIALDEKGSLFEEVHAALATHFSLHLAMIWKKGQDPLLERLSPEVALQQPVGGKTCVYFCQQGACLPPLTEKEEILKAIEAL